MLESGDARATILVIEDDPDVAQIETDVLESRGYRVRHATSGSEAGEILEEEQADLIILDLMLPDVDGLLLSTKLRSMSNIPIIICSALDSKRERVLGLKLGADDFIVKPFDPDEFEARIEAVLRRAAENKKQADEDARPAAQQLQVGDLVIDRSRRHVLLGGYPVDLTPTEYRLLGAFAGRPGEVLSREELAQLVWGYEDASSGRTIDVHIRRLRMKLASVPASPPVIVSVRGFGYRLEEHVGAAASA